MKQGLIVLMMLAGFALLFAACGGSSGNTGGNNNPPPNVACTIDAPSSSAYVPNSCTIKVGESVRFTNIAGHPLQPTGNNADNPIPNTIGTGQTEATVRFTKAGTYTFVCAFHPNMTGTIIVNP
jgi:plastocyanin